MSRELRDCSGNLQDFVFRSRIEDVDLGDYQCAFRERACFVESELVDAGEIFNRDTTAKENSVSRASCNRDKDR